MPLARFQASSQFPGLSTNENFVAENQVVQGRWEKSQEFMGTIASTAADAGNTDKTTTLRNGILLGKDSNGELTHFDPTGTAGSQQIDAVLVSDLNMLGTSGSAEDKHEGRLLAAGVVDPASLILAASTTRGIVGNAYEYHIRKQMAANGNFIMEDSPLECPLFNWKYESAVTSGTKTLTEADRDILWTNAGAASTVTFNLPTGGGKTDLAFYFSGMEDQNFTVGCNPDDASTLDKMIVLGEGGSVGDDAGADSFDMSTADHKIGWTIAIIGAKADNKWRVYRLSAGTITPAT